MKKSPEISYSSEDIVKSFQEMQRRRYYKLSDAALIEAEDEESETADTYSAISFVGDHFPEGVIIKEHFKPDGLRPLRTEEEFKEAFPLFVQEQLRPKIEGYDPHNGTIYSFSPEYWSHKDTAQEYIFKTEYFIKALDGEVAPPGSKEKIPRPDLVVYLDKSARPVSWFVEEFWSDFSKSPLPKKEHVAMDRINMLNYYEIEHDKEFVVDSVSGEKRRPRWSDFPPSKITDEMPGFLSALQKNGFDFDKIEQRIRDLTLDVEKEFDINGKIQRGEITLQDEYMSLLKMKDDEITKRLKEEGIEVFRSHKDLAKQTVETVARLRGLFVPGGLSEEEVKHPERIFLRQTGFEGKNITIVDEVVDHGTTRDLASHFFTWAFPDSNVSFCAFYSPDRLSDSRSNQDGQMLRIPFWYSLLHDDKLGRGILDVDPDYYQRRYESNPNNRSRAMYFGSIFLGVPLDYDKELDQKSISLRKQISRLRAEYEKGHIFE